MARTPLFRRSVAAAASVSSTRDDRYLPQEKAVRLSRLSIDPSRTVLICLVGLVLALSGLNLDPAAASASPVVAAVGSPGTACSPNSDDATVTTTGARCIAGVAATTRGRLNPVCLNGPSAFKTPPAFYVPRECGGNGLGGEAIAQARAISTLNANGTHDAPAAPGGIAPNIQWETSPGTGRRSDILVYDRNDTTVPIQIIEVKGTWNQTYEEAGDQLNGYVGTWRNLNAVTGRDAQPYDFATHPDMADEFVMRRQCGANGPVLELTYTVSAGAEPGVLKVVRTGPKCPPRSTGSGAEEKQNDQQVDEGEEYHDKPPSIPPITPIYPSGGDGDGEPSPAEPGQCEVLCLGQDVGAEEVALYTLGVIKSVGA
jgi:hypothetical protein